MPKSSGFDKYAEKLRRMLGPFGCQVRLLDYSDLLDVAKTAFDVRGSNIVEVAVAAEKLGSTERSIRVREAIMKHWPDPGVVWPATAPVRKMLKKHGVGR